ncbi:MAG: MarR family transcriptional regulator [Anaerolineales bacterium]|nr:MarR family transcriptional regulator [Anaerolineales bacterium]
MKDTSEALAREILEAVPFAMGLIREEMRRHRSSDITLPQFRTLLFLQRTPGAALHQVADHLGLTPPTVSKMIHGLSSRGLIERPGSAVDRRRVELRLTARGSALIVRVRGETISNFAVRLEKMRADEQENLIAALESLRRALQGKGIKTGE